MYTAGSQMFSQDYVLPGTPFSELLSQPTQYDAMNFGYYAGAIDPQFVAQQRLAAAQAAAPPMSLAERATWGVPPSQREGKPCSH